MDSGGAHRPDGEIITRPYTKSIINKRKGETGRNYPKRDKMPKARNLGINIKNRGLRPFGLYHWGCGGRRFKSCRPDQLQGFRRK